MPSVLCVLLLLLSLLGCTDRLPTLVGARPVTYALDNPRTTLLGRLVADTARGKVESGFSLVQSGPEALTSIRSLITLAGKTLDLQYYIWRNDETGRLLMRELVQAADRGVRVRLLLDDMEKDWPDDELARLNAHPYFEVRLFNPFSRNTGRLIDAILDFRRITNRMHNKIIIADNAIAVMGGRNVGNAYFAADEDANFRDLDIHVAGPIVEELSDSFDSFWNSYWSVSVRALNDGNLALPDLKTILSMPKAAKDDDEEQTVPVPKPDKEIDPKAHILEVLSRLAWTEYASVLADAPNKPNTDNPKLVKELVETVPTPQRELLIESAFFIPGERGIDALCAMVESGVRVRVLTNSLSSIDAITAYAGYREYREDILRCGVDLYELRPKGSIALPERSWSGSGTASILHTKAALIDGDDVFIGSPNLDPRSVFLNTEIALLIHSPELGAEVRRFMRGGVTLDHAYRLLLHEGEIVWITTENGERVHLTEEPGASFWDELVAGFIDLLPIEKQL